MKIALITEGDAEFKSLPLLLPEINSLTSNIVLKPLKVNVSPDAEPGVIARECKSRVLIAAARGAGLAVVLLDREQQAKCPGDISTEIEAAINAACNSLPVRVVLKDRLYENWLVADMDGLAAQARRFEVTAARRRRVEPNKADKTDGLALIKSMTLGGHYEKVQDAERICRHLGVERAAEHSRSLRHFLHVVGMPEFAEGCKVPLRP